MLAEANPPNSDNNPPVVSPTNAQTYTELETTISLENLATDAEGDPLTISVLNPVNGTVIFNPSTNKASFKPAPGFSGIASFDFLASDGFGSSSPARVTVNVSDVPLLNLDFVKRNLRLNAGENTELIVLGDFADQKGVVLPDSYLTYTSINPEVAPIDPTGKVTGLVNGTSILSASRNNLQAVTPIRIGTMPQPTTDAQLHQILAEMYGLDPYPDAVSLTPGGTRKLSLSLNSNFTEANLTAASTGTRYFSNNSNILNVSPDGTITAVGIGDATVTAIHGTAQTTIPVRVEAPRTGPATVGAAGGVVLSSDGELMVMMPPGALNSDTNVSIASKNRSELSLPVPTGFEFAGAFNLNFGDNSLEQPVQLAVPAPEGLPAGTEVYFMRKGALPDETGVWKPIWLQEESGVVGDDGTIRTSSPPYPGVVRPGEYMVVYSSPTGSATLVKGQLTLNYNFPLAFFGIIDPLGGIGQLIDPSNFVTNFGFTVSYDISSVKVIAIPTIGLPVVTELGVQRNSKGIATLEANLNIPTPAASNSAAAPKLQAASLKFKDENDQPFEGNEPILFLKASNVLASNLGDPKGSRLEDLVVKFYVGDRVYEQAVLPNLSATLGDNQFEVAVKVPNTVVLGESYISLSRLQNQLVGQNLTEPVYEEVRYNSNPIWLDTGTEYVFAALKGADAVAVLNGSDPKSVVADSKSSNLLLSTIPVGDGAIDRPRDLAVTSDGTRVYVALEQSGRVALVDPMVLQQVDTKPDTPGINPIDLPIGATPRSIAIDPRNQYAYISDGKRGNIYVLDIDPFSEKYHQVIQTISLNSVPNGLNEIAISSDGRKLFVAAPGTPTSQIFSVNIDPEDQPLDPSENPRKWHQQIGVVNTFAGAQGMAATADPNRMTFTNTGNDTNGFGVLTITNDDPTSFAATANKYAALGLGDFKDYFDVNRAVAVTVMRDGSYAFVASKNDSSQTGVESIDGVQAGSNIGIIKDPFGPTPKLVAATRPIPQGATTDLVLSNDNKYLYASYPTLSGGGGVYVFDTLEDGLDGNNKPKRTLSFEELASGEKYNKLVAALEKLNSSNGNVNTFWRAKVDGERFIAISKILDITAKKSTTGEELFSTRQTIGKEELLLSQQITEDEDFFLTRLGGAEYQTAYIDEPEKIPAEKLGDYASLMRNSALKLADEKGKYLKAAKRAFNYFMSTGNIAAMAALKPVFESPHARVNQELAVMEAVGSALDARVGAVPTLILQVGEARNMLNNAAEIIENRLSAVNIANGLRNLATGLPGNASDLLQQNGQRSITLAGLVRQTETLINQGLRSQVESIIETYLRNYYQPNP